MTQYRKNERGSIMVEVIAVLALMGVMGTLLFRQVARRNEELDNVNLASEIRMVKEATTAYIQAYKTELENKCLNAPDWLADKADINMFMPETWACDTDGDISDKTCLINDFDIRIYCYTVDEQMAPRKAFYAIILPQQNYLPNNFSILRAGRVANLIGSDGGVYDDKTLMGTMGAWEISCDSVKCPKDDYATYVATTGMDVYVPESETAPENAIAAPKNVAFERLHGTDYFAVGGGTNCIKNYDTYNNRFAHQILAAQNGEMNAQDDVIVAVNTTTDGKTGECEPLFWVSTADGVGDNHSAAGVVYMKNGLHIGRDNAKRRSAVVFDVASGQNPADADNKITVFDPSGNERLTLDGTGRIVGRSAANGGYRLDPERGEIVMFKTVKIDGEDLQIPTMRLRDGMLESSESATYATRDTDGNTITETKHYNVDPAHTSLMNDIRLASRGGARLSEILPKWILMNTQTAGQQPNVVWDVQKPTCPVGYIRGVVVTPIQFEHRVDSVTIPPLANQQQNKPSAAAIVQNDPLTINIADGINNQWNITLGYNNVGQGGQIIARADTYCIYRDSPADADSTNGVAHEKQSNQGVQNLHAVQPADRVRNCTVNADCANTETCKSGVCTVMGTCTKKDGEKVSENVYCVNGQQVEISCKKDSDCGSGKVCADYRCK